MPISSRLVKVTPAMAEKWLEGNTLNRVIKDKRVKFFADQMKRGEWLLSGSTLKFASDGTLLDGQHRLWACVEADVPFMTLVADGVDKKVFPIIDTNDRTPGDVLYIAGHKQYPTLLAQTASHIINYRMGDVGLFRQKLTRQEIMAFVNGAPELQELATLAMSTKTAVRKHTAVAMAICFMASKKHPQPARNFLKKFITGEELTAKNPILVLRNRLLAESNGLRAWERLSLCANAWNSYVTGKQITHLKVVAGATFPKIIGA